MLILKILGGNTTKGDKIQKPTLVFKKDITIVKGLGSQSWTTRLLNNVVNPLFKD